MAALPVAVALGQVVSLVLVVVLPGGWRLLGLLGVLPVVAVVAWSAYVERRDTARLVAAFNDDKAVPVLMRIPDGRRCGCEGCPGR